MKLILIGFLFVLCTNNVTGQSLYEFYFYEASRNIDEGNYEKANYYLTRGIARYPDSIDFYLMRGGNRFYLEQFDSSLVDISMAKQLGSESYYVPMFLGLIYHSQLKYPEAEENYLTYLKLMPSDSLQVTNYIRLLMDQKNYTKAESYTLDYQTKNPTSHIPVIMLGLISQQRGTYKLAVKYFTEYIDRTGGKDPFGYLNRSYAYKELGLKKEMCEDYWSIRWDPYTNGSQLYGAEGCEKILKRTNNPPPEDIRQPPPQEDIKIEHTPPTRGN